MFIRALSEGRRVDSVVTFRVWSGPFGIIRVHSGGRRGLSFFLEFIMARRVGRLVHLGSLG